MSFGAEQPTPFEIARVREAAAELRYAEALEEAFPGYSTIEETTAAASAIKTIGDGEASIWMLGIHPEVETEPGELSGLYEEVLAAREQLVAGIYEPEHAVRVEEAITARRDLRLARLDRKIAENS